MVKKIKNGTDICSVRGTFIEKNQLQFYKISKRKSKLGWTKSWILKKDTCHCLAKPILSISRFHKTIQNIVIEVGMSPWRHSGATVKCHDLSPLMDTENLLHFTLKIFFQNKWIHTVCKSDAFESFYWKTWRTDENGAASFKVGRYLSISSCVLWMWYRLNSKYFILCNFCTYFVLF